MTKAETVASYIRQHPEFEIVPHMDDPYGHMGATLTDAVLQRGIDYDSVVRPRVDRILTDYPSASTTSEFARVLRDNDVETVLRFKGRKPRTLLALVSLLVENQVECEHDLLVWLGAPEMTPIDPWIRTDSRSSLGCRAEYHFSAMFGLA